MPPFGRLRRFTNWWCYHLNAEVLMIVVSSTLLRWLARRLVEAVCRANAHWAVAICNTEPSALRPRRQSDTSSAIRFATGFFVQLDTPSGPIGR
jgi:hypothetical protein